MNQLRERVTAAKRTERPTWGMAADGYTLRSGAPTSILIQVGDSARWRRLMCWQFSNAGTLFVRIKGVEYIVDDYAVERALNA